jgi:glycosyltransferase involved in cell wall biosynthesis
MRLHPGAPNETLLDRQYEIWLERRQLTPERVSAIRSEMEGFEYRPLVSILMPVFNVREEWLRSAVGSVRDQLYTNWELCIVDDGSTARHISSVLREAEAGEARIRVRRLEVNEGICGASNHALSLARGEFVGLLDHDDSLTPDALYEVVKRLNEDPSIDFLYSDHDLKDARGRRTGPLFKPDWSPDLILSMNYITHFCTYRRSVIDQVGGFRKGFEGSQDHDLILRVTEHTQRIAHIAAPLCSWGQAPTSSAFNPKVKMYAHQAGKRAIEEALARRGVAGRVLDGSEQPFRYRVKRAIMGTPLVSIVIPTRGDGHLLRKCLQGLTHRTAYKRLEIIIVDDSSGEPEILVGLEGLPHRILRCPHPGSPATLENFAASRARGEYLLFLSEAAEAIEPGWLEAMLEHAQRPEVGAVGGKLLAADGTLQHLGIVVGTRGALGLAFRGLPRGHPGYYGMAKAIRDCSAVTDACLMTRRAVFDELGGFDEAFSQAYHDVDLCLRIRQRGYLVVCTPYAELHHHGPLGGFGEAHGKDESRLRTRWGHVFEQGDPYYNPNLTSEGLLYDLNS